MIVRGYHFRCILVGRLEGSWLIRLVNMIVRLYHRRCIWVRRHEGSWLYDW